MLGSYDLIVSQLVGPLVERPDELPKLANLFKTSDIPWFAWVIGLLVLILVIALEGAYREHQTADGEIAALTGRLERVPRNRDALVRSITNLEHRANNVIRDQYVLDHLKRERPELVQQGTLQGHDHYAEYRSAKDALEVESRVAGAAFNKKLLLFNVGVQIQVDGVLHPASEAEVDDDLYHTAETAITKDATVVIQQLDRGTLYFP